MSVSTLSVQAIGDVDDAAQLEVEWSDLWRRCPRAVVFQRPEWVLASWRHLAQGTPRVLLTVRTDGKLVAILPMRHSSANTLELEGAEVSDYMDALIDPQWQQTPAVAALVGTLTRCGLQVHFERLEAASPLLAQSFYGVASRIEACDVCPFVPIPPSAGDLSAVLPRGFYRRIQRSRKEVARSFRVQVRSATQETVLVMLDQLVVLHDSRWRPRGVPGVFAEKRVLDFYHESIPKLLDQDLVWLLELQLEGASAAAALSFCRPRQNVALHQRLLSGVREV